METHTVLYYLVMQVKCPKAKAWCVDVDSPPHPLLSRRPQTPALPCPRVAHRSWRKTHPQTDWSRFRFLPAPSHSLCICSTPFLWSSSKVHLRLSPSFFFFFSQRPCFFFIELLEQRKRSLLTAPTACLRACILSSVLTVNSLNPPLALGDPEIVSLCQLHCVRTAWDSSSSATHTHTHTHTQCQDGMGFFLLCYTHTHTHTHPAKNWPAMQETWIHTHTHTHTPW